MTKKIILSVIGIVVVILAILFLKSGSPELGSVGGGTYTRLATGADQTIAYGPAILHSVVFGDGADEVEIGDSKTSSSSNIVFRIDADVAGEVILDTIFLYGITATVTASNGETFIWSPK